MTTITLHVHQACDCLPDADTDILVLAEGDTEMQLGAYVGEESDGPVWTDAQGEILPRVVAWAEMPVLRQAAPVAGRIGREPELVPLVNGRAVDLGGAWPLPC